MSIEQQGKLKTIEQEYGEALETLIPRLLIDFGGVFKLAVRLNVYPNTIYHWLASNGFQHIDGQWQKVNRTSNKGKAQ